MLDRKRWGIIVAAVMILVVGSFWAQWQKTSTGGTVSTAVSAPGKAGHAPEAQAADTIVVHVSGMVNKAGLVRLPNGSRVDDAVQAAGGFAAQADRDTVNLAEKVKDGMQIRILPLAQEQPLGEGAGNGNKAGSASTQAARGKISINRAAAAELDSLPGIGPALAERIVEYRQTNGMFTNITDLRKVSGIGDAKFNQIKDKVEL